MSNDFLQLFFVIERFFASQLPDGLERVAENMGFIDREGAVFHSPVPDYSWPGFLNEGLATSLAGLLGVAVVLAGAAFLAKLLVGAGQRAGSRPE